MCASAYASVCVYVQLKPMKAMISLHFLIFFVISVGIGKLRKWNASKWRNIMVSSLSSLQKIHPYDTNMSVSHFALDVHSSDSPSALNFRHTAAIISELVNVMQPWFVDECYAVLHMHDMNTKIMN